MEDMQPVFTAYSMIILNGGAREYATICFARMYSEIGLAINLMDGFYLRDPWCSQILHAGNTNKNALKALIAAEYSGVQVEFAKNFEMGVTNKTPEFLKMNPIGKVCYKCSNGVGWSLLCLLL